MSKKNSDYNESLREEFCFPFSFRVAKKQFKMLDILDCSKENKT